MKRIAFFLTCFYCLTACNNVIMDDGQDIIIPDDTNPQIELLLPNAKTVSVYSTATESENTIDILWALAFNNGKKWVEKIEGARIYRNGSAAQLLPKLLHVPENGDTIVCIANCDPVTSADTIGVTQATISDRFRTRGVRGYYYGGEHLPMYGSFIWSDNSGYTCIMERSVAKVQVQLGTSVSDVTGNFTTDNLSWMIYNGAYAGRIKPTSPMEYISYPYSDLWMFTEESYRLLQDGNATQREKSIYLFEYPTSIYDFKGRSISSDVQFDSLRQCILLKKFNAINDTSYYRLDFYDFAKEKFIDTKRNHHYLFTINKVRSEGYNNIWDALKNPGSNIEYTIEIQDDAKRIISNGQYAIVSYANADTIDVLYNATSNLLMPDLAFDARFLFPVSSPYYPGLRNEITVSPSTQFSVNTSQLTGSRSPIEITVLNPMTTPNLTLGYLDFYLGNIHYRVVLRARRIVVF